MVMQDMRDVGNQDILVDGDVDQFFPVDSYFHLQTRNRPSLRFLSMSSTYKGKIS